MKNREIKFRALRFNGNGWAFGSIIQPNFKDDRCFIVGWNGARFVVNNETIARFTGLKDKNGKEIYEGDILQIESDKLMVVGWSEKFASFILNREGWMFSHWFGESCNPESCIIKGNIHENPELLNS